MSSGEKPADAGTGVVCASFGQDGSWLSVGCLHPVWGFVEVNGLPPFDERWRGDAAATRRYRRLVAEPRGGWLRVEPGAPDARELVVSTADPEAVSWFLHGEAEPLAVAFGGRGSRRMVQRWRTGDGIERVVRVSGRLDRPPLAEITEVDPPPLTAAVTALHAEGSRLLVRAGALPAVAAVDASTGQWALAGDGAELRIAPDVAEFEISVTLAPSVDVPAEPEPPDAGDVAAAPVVTRRDPPASWIERVAARSLAYVRSCTALALEPGECAILTDHRLLPLSWTRDAYYQALLLLASGEAWAPGLVADHLRWLWRRCERPNGRWMRSHHGNGQPKDLAWQADQQLYPFVELADLWRWTGSLPDGVAWERVVPEAWRVVLAAIDAATGLIPSDETSADDPVGAPFVAASQVVLWYTAVRLAEPALAARIGLASDELLATAERVRAAFDRLLVVGGRWAYAVDGRGGSVDYHDANDLPTALAPAWGFCPPDDAAWRATTAFAFSAANPGFVAGPDGGLGSRHTAGVWTLGLIQAWLVARIAGHGDAARAALERLERVAFPDGMLPEAVATGGEARTPIRHWFAWPGAALAAFWLLHEGRLLDGIAAEAPSSRREPA